jgi:hypothetical protein
MSMDRGISSSTESPNAPWRDLVRADNASAPVGRAQPVSVPVGSLPTGLRIVCSARGRWRVAVPPNRDSDPVCHLQGKERQQIDCRRKGVSARLERSFWIRHPYGSTDRPESRINVGTQSLRGELLGDGVEDDKEAQRPLKYGLILGT